MAAAARVVGGEPKVTCGGRRGGSAAVAAAAAVVVVVVVAEVGMMEIEMVVEGGFGGPRGEQPFPPPNHDVANTRTFPFRRRKTQPTVAAALPPCMAKLKKTS